MTTKEIRKKLMKPVGKPVKFKYPGGGVRKGRLLDRRIVESLHGHGANYWDVVDLIEFPEERYKQWIRVSYYRQVGDLCRWAGQTSITEPIHIMRQLMREVDVLIPPAR